MIEDRWSLFIVLFSQNPTMNIVTTYQHQKVSCTRDQYKNTSVLT